MADRQPKAFRKRFFHPPVGDAYLRVNAIGVEERMPPGIVDRPSGTGDHLFMFFSSEAVAGSSKGDSSQPPGTLVLWRPGDAQYYGNPSGWWPHSWIHLDGPWAKELLARSGLPACRPIHVGDPSFVDRYLLGVYSEAAGHIRPNIAIVRNLIECMLIEAARLWKGDAEGLDVPDKLLEARRHLERSSRERHSLAELARRAGMSASHFSNEFKRCFGDSPINYLVGLRMREAWYLLKDRNLRVSEVARLVGYDDIYHFSRLFKRRTGSTPSGLRRRPK